MSAIVGKMLEPVVTPYLVLHADNGEPTALINLEDQMITDYSTDQVANIPSDSEHKELILEFKEELHNSLIEGGWDQFSAGLIIPAIPLLPKNKLGSQLYKNLHVYVGAEHPHAGQQPKEIKL